MSKKIIPPVFPKINVPQVSEKGLQELILDVQKRLNIQLTSYKQDYIKRRLLSRMNSTRSKNFVEYHQYLRTHPEEEDKLRKALTINVTKFLRDPNVFNLVGKEIFPVIIQEKKTIKIWSAGCSSGEEPYTYAILLYDQSRPGVLLNNVIIATDIDEVILNKAKAGIYEKTALENLSDTQISKHFEKTEDGKFKIKDHIKNMVKFQTHDLMTGVPIARMFDIVSCRNVTIYFNEQQKKDLVKVVHDSLGSNRFYIMGMSEYMSKDVEHLFKPFKPMLKIFQKAS